MNRIRTPNEGENKWLRGNIGLMKASAVINMQEQIIETRTCKRNRGMHINLDKCVEWIVDIASGYTALAGNECLKKHNNVLKVLMTTWLCRKDCWKKTCTGTSWNKKQGNFIENNKIKLCWDFEHQVRNDSTARRLEVTTE